MLHNFFHVNQNKLERKPLEAWQKKRLWVGVLSIVLIGTLYIGGVCLSMLQNKSNMVREWSARQGEFSSLNAEADERSVGAVEVLCGTYVESFRELSLRNSNFRVVMLAWFKWQGSPDLDIKSHFRFYRGSINSTQVVTNEQQPDGTNYQLVRLDVTISKDFNTSRFPLDSHQLNIYLETDYPIEKVRLRLDSENSSLNSSLGLAGYKLIRAEHFEQPYLYANTHGDPALSKPIMTSEVVTSIGITRDGFGLYLKCFIALLGTTLWVFITLFLCTYHRVDPLGMIPAALFGTVSNIMVGANLLPDALSQGLLEYVNTWGVFTILAGAMCIININRIRNEYKDQDFARFFGRVMFVLLVFFVVAGHILMPLAAYVFA